MQFELQFITDELPDKPVQIKKRTAIRGVIHYQNKLLMVRTNEGDYKFPGGGIEEGETKLQALVRETQEEAGLLILPDSIRELGYVHRVEPSDQMDCDCFVQDNFYYLCRVQRGLASQQLDDYEAEEGYTLEWVEPERAITVNRTADHGPTNQNMLEREARVLELLRDEGYFSEKRGL